MNKISIYVTIYLYSIFHFELRGYCKNNTFVHIIINVFGRRAGILLSFIFAFVNRIIFIYQNDKNSFTAFCVLSFSKMAKKNKSKAAKKKVTKIYLKYNDLTF